MANINLKLGGKSYALPPLSLHLISLVTRRLHFGTMHDRDYDILHLVWPQEAPEPLDAIEGATHAEITAAAEQIIAAAGLKRTPRDLAWRKRNQGAAA